MKRLVLCSVALLTFLVPTIAQADEWVQYRYDGSGANPNQAPVEASRWRVRWSKQPNVSRVFRSDPLISEDSVYVAGYKGSRVALWSFDLATGHINWVTEMPCGRFTPHLIMGSNEIVVTNTDDDTICADDLDWTYFVDTETGDKSRIPYGGLYNATLSGPDTAVEVSRQLRLFDLVTHTYGPRIGESFPMAFWDSYRAQPVRVLDGEAWIFADETPGPRAFVGEGVAIMPGGTEARGVPLDGSPIVHYGSCPAASCAVDVATHAILWTAPMDFALIHDGVAYGSCSGLCARDLRTGEVVWSTGFGSQDPPMLAGGVLWASDGTTIRGYDPATGVLVSRRPFSQKMGPPGGVAMAMANGYLVSTGPVLRVVSFDRT